MCLLPAQVVPGLSVPFRLRGLTAVFCLSLFDAERAIRDILGENPRLGNVVEITLGPKLRALLAGELQPDLDSEFEVPDFLPKEWRRPPLKNHRRPPLKNHRARHHPAQSRAAPARAGFPKWRQRQMTSGAIWKSPEVSLRL